jgi:uncharacterized membrane protein YphA (DoxX/SURF4 family)
MKKTIVIYWIFTGLLAALMLASSIPNIMSSADSIEFMSKHMGYPVYLIPFIGVAKLLGVIALLVPGFPKIKEWAYAGFTFDLLGAMYSFIALGDPFISWAPLFVGLGFVAGSYIYYHKKIKEVSSK